MLEVNARLQAEAARLGADAVIRVTYTKTVGLLFRRRLKADGIAVKRVESIAEDGKSPAIGPDVPDDENAGDAAIVWSSYSYCG
jgi:hypothetical protein